MLFDKRELFGTGKCICFLLIICCSSILLTQGCSTTSTSVIAATGTTIGVELSQNQTTQTPTAVLGYKRAELAYVPTNRGTAGKTTTTQDAKGNPVVVQESGLSTHGDGAKDSANVLMELNYRGIFTNDSKSGIYQRLAVGDKAVSGPGASVMFAKNIDGTLDDNAAAAVNPAQANLSKAVSASDLDKAYEKAKQKAKLRRSKIEIIIDGVKKDDDISSVDAQKLAALVTKASLDTTQPFVKAMLKLQKTKDLYDFLDEPGEAYVEDLFKANVT